MAGNKQKTNIWIDGSQAGATLTELKKKVALLNREIKDLPRNSDEYKKKVSELKEAGGALDQHRKAIKGVSDSYKPAKSGLKSLIGQFAPMALGLAVAAKAIQVVKDGIVSWYQNNKQMEKSLSSLQSITGASTQDLKFYKKEAIEIGETTTLSATQAVEAFKLIGSARPDLLKSKEALSSVTREAVVLAEAAGIDLATSAQSLTGTMNQFNLGAEHSARIINALAAGSKEGAAEISDISLAIDKFGTVAAANNVTIEESVALTEVMAEKNIKGAEAGTKLRNVLLSVSTASGLPQEALSAMDQYGVNLDIVTNKALPLKDRLTEMAKVQGDQNALLKIFGKENIVAGQTILGNIQKFDILTNAVTGTNLAYEQQAINNDNLDGDLKSMGSAWEGLTLSMEGGNNVFRAVVQSITSLLHYVKDTIKAFSEWDITKIQTSLLKFYDTITLGLSPFSKMIKETIRMNELTSSVVDGMKEQANASTVLTSALKLNKSALESGNLSAEDTLRLQEENKGIISKLNEQYPELTKNMDLQTASAEELSTLQKDINSNLLEQSINAVQAAEAERILSEVVKNSMELAQQRAKESKRWAVTNFVADIFTDDAEDIEKANEKLKKQLKELPDTMKEVAKQIEDINPQFGQQYKENARVLTEAYDEIKKIKEELKTAEGADKKALEGQLAAQRKVIENFKNKNEELKASALEEQKINEAALKSEEEKTKTQEENYKKQQKAKKEHNDAMKKLQKELEKVIEESEKIQSDLKNQNTLDALKTERERELFELEISLDEKYKAELESATKLAEEKGNIGKQALEQKNLLESLKAEELEKSKLKINEKFDKIQETKDTEENAKELEKERTLQEAIAELKVTKAKVALNAIQEGDLSGYRKAKAELEKALKEQLELELKHKKTALEELEANEIISIQELNARKEELELEHQQAILDIAKQSAEEQKQIDNERLQNALSNLSEILNVAKDFSDAALKKEMNNLKKANAEDKKELDKKFKNKEITEQQYRTQKDVLDKEFAMKQYEIELKQFNKDQIAAKAQAVINGALAVTKVTAQTGIGAAIAVPLVIASTAAQLLKIDSESPPEMPQYAGGGYTDVVGANDGLRYKAKRVGRLKAGLTPQNPSLALVSEKGPEYFVPNGLLRNQKVANYVGMIEAIRTNQYADGGFTSSGQMQTSDPALANLIMQQTAMMNRMDSTMQNLKITFSEQNIEDLETNQTRLANVKK